MEWYVVGKWELREVFQVDMPLSDSAYARLNINASAETLNLFTSRLPTISLHLSCFNVNTSLITLSSCRR